MPRYFFDISDGKEVLDPIGSDWPDLAAVRAEAVRYSAEALSAMPEQFWNCEMWTMFVSDQDRRLLFTLKFLAENAPGKPLPLRGISPALSISVGQ